LCCQDCASTVKEDPAKYIAQLEKQGVTLAEATIEQTVCPVDGGKIDKNAYVDVDGKRVYLCCQDCASTVKEDPAKYIAQLQKQGFTLAEATIAQTVCPVMGGKINKNLFVDAMGKRIYVCCAGCTDKIKADPTKYINMIEEQGISLEKITH